MDKSSPAPGPIFPNSQTSLPQLIVQVRGHQGKILYLVQHLPVQLVGALALLRWIHRVIQDVGVPVYLLSPDPSTLQEVPGVIVPLDEGIQLQVELADKFTDQPGKRAE